MNSEKQRVWRYLCIVTLGAFLAFGFESAHASDTVAPPKENAEFAAKHIPGAELEIISGGHEIYTNTCDEDGKDEIPDLCIDVPGVGRAKIHEAVGAAALKFFGAHLRGAGQD